jgi:hypothetical protein
MLGPNAVEARETIGYLDSQTFVGSEHDVGIITRTK